MIIRVSGIFFGPPCTNKCLGYLPPLSLFGYCCFDR